MYIQLVPSFIKTGLNNDENPQIFSVEIPELNLKINHEDLKSTKPYTNKKYVIGSLNKQKNGYGILLYTHQKIDKFTTIYTWKNRDIFQKHVIINFVEDHDFQLISQCITHNMGYENFPSRLYSDYKKYGRVFTYPVFRNDIENFNNKSTFRQPLNIIKDTNETIVEIHDEIHLHSIEKERIGQYLFLTKKYCKTEEALIV